MKIRIGAFLMAAVMLLVMLPVTAFAAPAVDTGNAGVCHGRDFVNGGAVHGEAPALNEAPIDTSVDYKSILGISDATAQKFGEMLRATLRDYRLSCDVSSLGIKVNPKNTKQLNAFYAMMEHEVYYAYDTFMYDTGRYTWYNNSNYLVTSVKFYEDDFKYTYGEYHANLNLIHSVADNMLKGIEGNNSLTHVQKALLVHDRLAEWCEYDYEKQQNKTLPKESYTAYGIMWLRTGVCQGYAEVYAYLLDRLGIKNRFAQSTALNHIWNIVTISGKEYYVDVTWDDPNWDRYGQVTHDNFLVSYNRLYKGNDNGQAAHKASDYTKIPQVSTYDDAFWTESHAAFQLINGYELYYLDNVQETANYDYTATLCKWTGSSRYELCNIVTDVRWTDSREWVWRGNYSYLASRENKLYFNTAKKIWCYEPSSRSVYVYGDFTTALSPTNCIFGFTIDGEQFRMNFFNAFPTSRKEMTSSRRYWNHKGVISRMEIVKKPKKQYYKRNEALDCTGLVLRAYYDDGTYEDLSTGYGYKGWKSSSYGKTTVTITYTQSYSQNGLETQKTFELPLTLEVQVSSLSKSSGVYVKQSDSKTTISWKKVSGATRYAVYRSYKSGSKWSSWTKVGTTASTSYADKSMPSNKIVRYSVRAYNGITMGAHSISKTLLCKVSTPKAYASNVSTGIKVS